MRANSARKEPKAMPAAIHMAEVSKIPGAMWRSDLRPAGRNLCARTSASDQAVERLKTRREVQRGRPHAGQDLTKRAASPLLERRSYFHPILDQIFDCRHAICLPT